MVLSKLEVLAIEVMDELDRIAIRHNRDMNKKQIQREFIMKAVSKFMEETK